VLEAGANSTTRPDILAGVRAERDVILVTGSYRPCASTGVIVIGGCVYRRQFNCC
jgi:hypothetical protein